MNPWDEYIERWQADSRGMVLASMADWKDSFFPEDWISEVRGDAFELGPGGGRQTAILAKNKCSIDIADLSKEILDAIKNTLSIRETYLLQRESTPPRGTRRYDTFIACYVFCHCSFYEMWKYLNWAGENVRIGGTAIFDVKEIREENWDEVQNYYFPCNGRRYGTGEFQIRFVSEETIKCLCRHTGFEIVERRQYPLGTAAYRVMAVKK